MLLSIKYTCQRGLVLLLSCEGALLFFAWMQGFAAEGLPFFKQESSRRSGAHPNLYVSQHAWWPFLLQHRHRLERHAYTPEHPFFGTSSLDPAAICVHVFVHSGQTVLSGRCKQQALLSQCLLRGQAAGCAPLQHHLPDHLHTNLVWNGWASLAG